LLAQSAATGNVNITNSTGGELIAVAGQVNVMSGSIRSNN